MASYEMKFHFDDLFIVKLLLFAKSIEASFRMHISLFSFFPFGFLLVREYD